jgi:hypothetical protein
MGYVGDHGRNPDVDKSRGLDGDAVEYCFGHLVLWYYGMFGNSSSRLFFVTYIHVLILPSLKLISLIYGGNFNLLRPELDRDHEEYVLGVVMEQFKYFGPFPAKISEIVSPETVQSILWIMQEIPQEKLTSFSRTTEKEVSKKDKDFICKMMKLDWRDRPTAKELLTDEWWADED